MTYPTSSSASDVWSLRDVYKAKAGGDWPELVWTVDLSNITYDSVSFSITSEEPVPESFVFNSDGTKMYVVGRLYDSVFQYSLSTAFDLSTASYDSVSFSVSGQDASPLGLAFNNDGTKMYVVGNDNNRVYQYSLSTEFDLSTASYDSVSFSVGPQEITPTGLTFNSDGTKMYVVGTSNDSVFQYTLSTAFDLSTASYDSVSFDISSQETAPAGLTFNSNGTKMYVVGNVSDSVLQYTLSTAYDLSTASYDSVSFSVSSEDDNPGEVQFSNDGTKMYIVGNQNDSIHQYSTGL